MPIGGGRAQTGTLNVGESTDLDALETKQEPAVISVMTSDKRIYSKKVLEGIDTTSSGAPTADFSLPPPGNIILSTFIEIQNTLLI